MTTPVRQNERRLTIARAMAEALAQEMRADPRVFVMGEDIAKLGGVFGNTRGLLEEFGPGARPRHADLRDRLHRRRRRRGVRDRHASGRRTDVRRFLRRLHGRNLQPDGQEHVLFRRERQGADGADDVKIGGGYSDAGQQAARRSTAPSPICRE